jgi:Flp pilus assembly protein TadG
MTPARRARRPRHWHSEHGSELVEFAFASSILLMTIFGILQGGVTVWRYNHLANLAQDGARYAAVRGLHSDAAMRAEGTDTAIRTFVQGRALGSAPTVTVSPTNPNTLSAGSTVTVTVSQSVVTVWGFVPWSGTLTASATMSMVR